MQIDGLKLGQVSDGLWYGSDGSDTYLSGERGDHVVHPGVLPQPARHSHSVVVAFVLG